jgi:hypothetical protein
VEALVNELMVTMGTMRCYFLQWRVSDQIASSCPFGSFGLPQEASLMFASSYMASNLWPVCFCDCFI